MTEADKSRVPQGIGTLGPERSRLGVNVESDIEVIV
jgi:hypothetical protein